MRTLCVTRSVGVSFVSLSLAGAALPAQDGGQFLPPFNHHNWKDAEGAATRTQPYRYSVDSTQWLRARRAAC